jgi:DNA glycosylase AlkZ-like
MAVTTRQLNRATLARQQLLRRRRSDVVEAVRRIVALQAQEAASPYIALWNRVSGFRPGDLDAAFASHAVVKATLMRVTLHAVAREDHDPFLDAMQPTLRAARLNDRRFRRSGLSADDADALLPEVRAFASQPRSNADVEAWLDARIGVSPKPGVWWAMRQYGPFVHAPTGGPWSFGPRPAYVAAPSSTADPTVVDSLQWLVRRYLAGFGPASVLDVAQFALINRPRARAALEAMGPDLLELEGPGGVTLFDLPDAPRPGGDRPAPPRLLPMWDSVLLAHADRSRVIAPDHRPLVMRRNGDVLPTVLIDGVVAGVWRPAAGGIEVTAFDPQPDEAWAGIDREARGLLALLADRDPGAYGRYGHWWATLPRDDVRVVGT